MKLCPPPQKKVSEFSPQKFMQTSRAFRKVEKTTIIISETPLYIHMHIFRLRYIDIDIDTVININIYIDIVIDI